MTLVVDGEDPGTVTVWLPFSHQPLALLRPANAGSAANSNRLRTLILHHRLHHHAHHLVGVPHNGRRADRLPASLDLVIDLVDEQAHIDRHRVDMKHRSHCHIFPHHQAAGTSASSFIAGANSGVRYRALAASSLFLCAAPWRKLS